jgi:hypothetical protein
MTDEQLERRLRDWYRTEIPTEETAPAALRSSVMGVPVAAPMRPRLRAGRRGMTLLAAAALLATAIAGGALLAGSDTVLPSIVVRPTVIPVPSTSIPSPSALPGFAELSPSPSEPLATPSTSLEPCLTDSVQVLTGDARPEMDAAELEGLGQSRGVYTMSRSTMLWAANPGRDTVTPLASIEPEANILDVLDISPDGASALIRVGNISPQGFTNECADLFSVRTDGSMATRLTTFGTGRFVTGAAFSPDGRQVAYSWWAPDTITTLDLESGGTIDQRCSTVYSAWPLRIDWSPTGLRFAAACGRTLTVFDAGGATAPATFRMADEPLAFSWTDDRRLIVASAGGNIYSFDALSEASTVLGRFEDPAIEIVIGSGVFSLDGRWLMYRGGERGDVPGNEFTEVGYLVAASGGIPIRIPGDVQEWTWSDDGLALVHISTQEGALILVRTQADTLESVTIGTISDRDSFPLSYRQGIWRVP